MKFAALDQLRINIALMRDPTAARSLGQDFGGGFVRQSFEAFWDTGASGLPLSLETADGFGVQQYTVNDAPVVFSDVGIGGSADFRVPETLHIAYRRWNQPIQWAFLDPVDFQTDFPGRQEPFRMQVGPVPVPDNPLLADLNVFRVPMIRNRVNVMDGRPVNETNLATGEDDVMNTELSDRGTPFRPQTTDENPGIVPVTRKVKMSKGNFKRFTSVTSVGAEYPSLTDNPFVGPNLTRGAGVVDNTPGVKVSLGNRSTTGSFLFDTGAAVSFVSMSKAAEVGVRYVRGTLDVDGFDPAIEVFNP